MRIEIKCPCCACILAVPNGAAEHMVVCPECRATLRASVQVEEMNAGDLHSYYWWIGRRDAIATRLRGPAVALMVTGLLGLAADILQVVYVFGLQEPPLPANSPDWLGVMLHSSKGLAPALAGAFFALVSFIVMLGGVAMATGRAYWLGITASILSMLNVGNFCFVLGLPFGIWSLTTLRQSDVQSTFREIGSMSR